jgi:hypothetical protein
MNSEGHANVVTYFRLYPAITWKDFERTCLPGQQDSQTGLPKYEIVVTAAAMFRGINALRNYMENNTSWEANNR